MTGTVGIVLVTFIVFMYAIITESAVLGIAQRLFIGAVTLWVVMQSVRLYRLGDAPGRGEPRENRIDPTEAKAAD